MKLDIKEKKLGNKWYVCTCIRLENSHVEEKRTQTPKHNSLCC